MEFCGRSFSDPVAVLIPNETIRMPLRGSGKAARQAFGHSRRLRFTETSSVAGAYYLRSNINARLVFPIGPFVLLLRQFRNEFPEREYCLT